MNWLVTENKKLIKTLNKLPLHIQASYSYWRSLIINDGIEKVIEIKGFNFEKLKGRRQKEYSCRLSRSYRVNFKIDKKANKVIIMGVNKHEY